ncbi:MAG: SCO family protein [Rhodobacter sp.]|nr:SCO family protein [Rhodobacter sp.]
MTRLYAGLAAAAVAALLGVSAWYVLLGRFDDAFSQCRQGQIAGGDIGGPFTLVNPAGQTVTDADVLTKPALVYFGYTFCPDVCPFDMSRNAEAVDILEERGFDVTPVFISIDPDRDTPEIMGDYAANLHPKLIALTGSPEQIKVASQTYKTFYKRQPAEDEFYLVDHSTFTYLMLPGIGFVDFFRREATSDQMADAVACFLQASAGTN